MPADRARWRGSPVGAQVEYRGSSGAAAPKRGQEKTATVQGLQDDGNLILFTNWLFKKISLALPGLLCYLLAFIL